MSNEELREKIEAIYRFWVGPFLHPDFSNQILAAIEEDRREIQDLAYAKGAQDTWTVVYNAGYILPQADPTCMEDRGVEPPQPQKAKRRFVQFNRFKQKWEDA